MWPVNLVQSSMEIGDCPHFLGDFMNYKSISKVVIILVILLSLGCSVNRADPFTPPDSSESCMESGRSHTIWGLWQFRVDPVCESVEVVPLRGAEHHLNALPFLEPPPSTNLTVEFLDFNGNQVTADIGLRHPFLGSDVFTGFDVCGIFITSGSVTGFDDPDLRMTGPGETRLLNPDGYSRWWNPSEFPVNTGTMESYNDGLLGTPDAVADFNCTLNGYKYFADGLSPGDGLELLDPAARGVFSAGQKNVRRYIILMESGLVFNYAVDACWKFPTGSAPYDIPEDFSLDTNRPESWRVDISETINTLWNDGADSGGILNLSLDVYDHLNSGMNVVKVESPGNFAMVSSGSPVGGGEGYSTFEIGIIDATPAEESIDLLITVESEKIGYGGLLPGKTVSAYFTCSVDVAPGEPVTGIYVDGDNTDDPLEDGSMPHPYDTIEEGINNAGTAPSFEDVYDIYVDPYEGGDYAAFSLKDDVQLHGDPWNDGAGKPLIVLTDEWVMGDNASGCLVENFIFAFEHTSQISGMLYMINLYDCDDITLKDCKFTGQMASQYSIALYLEHCDGFELNHNEFVGIRNKSLHDPGTHRLYALMVLNSDNGLIIHNEMHDIGYDDEGPQTTSNYTAAYMMFFLDESGDHCDNLQILNNLFYDYNDFSKTSGTAKNFFHVFGWGDTVGYISIPNFVWANNTADDISVIGDDTSAAGCASLSWGRRVDNTWTVKNSIISNMAPVSSITGSYHRGFWAEISATSVAVDYSCCYNLGSPGPGVTVDDYYDNFTKGTGSFGISDNEDPAYDMTPGPNWYHVTNTALVSDDDTEMGAFGGTYGDWTPPSQE